MKNKNGKTSNGTILKLKQLKHQANIVRGARTYDRAYTGPLYVQIGPVNACNYRCTFCWDHPTYVEKDAPWPDKIAEKYYTDHPEIDRNKAHMPYEMYTDLVDDLYAMGTRKIKYIGRGESFLHPRFVDMVAYAKSKGFNCSVTTNGSLITDDNIRDLVGMGLDEIFVSVNAASAKSYNEIHLHTTPNAFDNIVQTLKIFSQERERSAQSTPFMHLSFVIQNNNYFEMPDMVRLAHDVGAQRVAFNRISVYEGTTFLKLSESQDVDALERALPEAERLGKELGVITNADFFRTRSGAAQRSKDIHTTVPCYIGWFFSIILADGTVNPCCECLRAIGTLKKDRFKDIWFGETYRKFRGEITDLPKTNNEVSGCRCYNCSFASHNLSMHKVAHPLAATVSGKATYGLKDLKRFVFG